jgi:hypothetical protein
LCHPEPELITLADVSELVGVSPSRLVQWARLGRFPAPLIWKPHLGGSPLWSAASLRPVLARRAQEVYDGEPVGAHGDP